MIYTIQTLLSILFILSKTILSPLYTIYTFYTAQIPPPHQPRATNFQTTEARPPPYHDALRHRHTRFLQRTLRDLQPKANSA